MTWKKWYFTTTNTYESIHDWIDKWHMYPDLENYGCLNRFLGLTDAEYGWFVKRPCEFQQYLEMQKAYFNFDFVAEAMKLQAENKPIEIPDIAKHYE